MLSRFMTRREQAVLVFFGTTVVIGSLVIYFRADRAGAEANSIPPAIVAKAEPPSVAAAEAPSDPAPLSSTAAVPAAAPMKIAVSVVGAVERPGVYRLKQDERIQDLIDAAGGAGEDADVSDINLAAKLIDGTTLVVPKFEQTQTRDGRFVRTGRAAAPPPNPPQYTLSGWTPGSVGTASTLTTGATSAEPGAAGLIDLNRATQVELETLPGIGPVLAAAIVAHRTEKPFQSIDELENVSGIGPKRFAAVRGLITVR
jgi:competence protein ComEA